MQFFWLYIDDLVGKGLGIGLLFKLTGLVAITWVPLALPLSILLSSIITFGNLGETYELVAIKSAGVSLLRFMLPLFVASIIIAIMAFVFANNIIPVANLKFNALKVDIIRTKPALDIKEGTFYNKIEGYVIKIGEKDKVGNTIRDIVIFEKRPFLQDNLIIAKSGNMDVSPNKKYLVFTLHDGWFYEEKGNVARTTKNEFIQLKFDTYKKLFDLSSFALVKTEDSLYRDNSKMLSARQLFIMIDSLTRTDKFIADRFKYELAPFLPFSSYNYQDTALFWKQADSEIAQTPILNVNQLFKDSLPLMKAVITRTQQQVINAFSGAQSLVIQHANKLAESRDFLLELHRKFALSFACIVLFLVGAPLGSIIRKGGLGSPLVFATLFFIFFHILNTFGEKLAKERVLSPFFGMWLGCLILFPIALFLIYHALQDSQVISMDTYTKMFRKTNAVIMAIFKKKKRKGL